jgi:hypothetical protein
VPVPLGTFALVIAPFAVDHVAARVAPGREAEAPEPLCQSSGAVDESAPAGSLVLQENPPHRREHLRAIVFPTQAQSRQAPDAPGTGDWHNGGIHGDLVELNDGRNRVGRHGRTGCVNLASKKERLR